MKFKNKTFAEKVYEAASKIPRGKVATYTQIAKLIGNKDAYRAVGNALHKNPFAPRVPCHRVVDSEGNTAENFGSGQDQQILLLRFEGVDVINGKVNLKKFGWKI